jgi:hypothetical protein
MDLFKLVLNEQHFNMADADGPSPLDEAISETEALLRQLHQLRNHVHDFDARGFCRLCGWDGNA